jgi:hypothetical protein
MIKSLVALVMTAASSSTLACSFERLSAAPPTDAERRRWAESRITRTGAIVDGLVVRYAKRDSIAFIYAINVLKGPSQTIFKINLEGDSCMDGVPSPGKRGRFFLNGGPDLFTPPFVFEQGNDESEDKLLGLSRQEALASHTPFDPLFDMVLVWRWSFPTQFFSALVLASLMIVAGGIWVFKRRSQRS